jgi:energy-coupling factor transport system substrate-specific component
MSRFLNILEPILLIAIPASLLLCAYFQINNSALLTAIVAICALVPFFLRLEFQKPKLREIMPIAVLSAIGIAGRILFAAVPNFKPVTAITVIAGASFGRQAGFLVGALIALCSNIFFGQGPWTPWQMYAWGLAGYLAGVFANVGFFKHKPIVFVYGFIISLVYGFILDSWTLVGFINPISWGSAIAVYGAGLTFSLIHAVATVIFLIPVYGPWMKKFERIKQKFGLL